MSFNITNLSMNYDGGQLNYVTVQFNSGRDSGYGRVTEQDNVSINGTVRIERERYEGNEALDRLKSIISEDVNNHIQESLVEDSNTSGTNDTSS